MKGYEQVALSSGIQTFYIQGGLALIPPAHTVATTSVYSQLPSLKIVVNVAKERGERGVLKI